MRYNASMSTPGDPSIRARPAAPHSGPLPLIIGLIADLFFSVKVESVARRLGFRLRLIERAEQVAPGNDDDPMRPSEPLEGPAAAFVHLLVEEQPALIVVDLNNHSVPWERWIATVKSSAATRRIPVIAFGSHMDVETQTKARQAGADAVLARSRFVEALPELIDKHARLPDRAAIALACQGELSALARRGIELFNAGEYFEAHEELEHAWNDEEGQARELYRAILQVAVAYLQITRQNYRGAAKMFLRLRQWMDPLPDICRGVHVGVLRRQAQAAREALLNLGEERIAEFDRSLLRPVEWEGAPNDGGPAEPRPAG